MAAAIGLVLILPFYGSPYLISFVTVAFMYVALSGSWNLFSGLTGYVSLGHGLFFGIGAYAFAVTVAKLGMPVIVGFTAAAVVAGAFSMLLGFILLTTRIRVAYFAIMMLGFNEIIKTVVANTKSVGSSYGLTIPPIGSNLVAYYFLFCVAAAVTALAYTIQCSRWGYGLKAILADEIAAEVTGVGIVGHKMAMFTLSALFAGLVGGMIAWYWSYIDPYMAFDLVISFEMVVMAVFGGIGTVWGPVLGALIMSSIKEILSTTLPYFHTIIFGALVTMLVIWCPGGMMQLAERTAQLWRHARSLSGSRKIPT